MPLYDGDGVMITVLGATGFTGRLVVEELRRRRLPVRLAGRNADKLEALVEDLGERVPTMVADVTRPETLPPALEGARVLINCVGPFTDLGEPVVAAAVRQGVHYLDTTGEQAFIKLVFDRYGDQARRREVVVAPGAAFEYALADAAAEVAGRELEPCEEVSIVYAISGFGASRGTKKSVLRVMSGEGYLYREGRLVRARLGAVRRSVHMPGGQKLVALSFPGGEVIHVPQHVETRSVIPMMAFSSGRALLLPLGLSLLRAAMIAPLREWIFRRIEAGPVGPSPEARATTRFTLLVEARRGEDRRAVIAEGCDPYGLTAVVIVALAAHLLEEGPRELGALSPAMVAGPEAIIDSTGAAGVRWLR